MPAISARMGLLAPMSPAGGGFAAAAPAPQAAAQRPGFGADSPLWQTRPTPAPLMSPDARKELESLKQQVALLNQQLHAAMAQMYKNQQAGHCPCCGPNCTCHTQGVTPGVPCCPQVGPAPAFQGPAVRPAWCAPGDPTCDPAANPSLLRPSWCKPGDPTCDPAANPSLLRPSWCKPGDPTCDPAANPSLLRPSWCTPGDPSCDPSANLSLLRPSWCKPGDPTCDPAANPALLRPYWCKPGDPTCDPSANPSLLAPRPYVLSR